VRRNRFNRIKFLLLLLFLLAPVLNLAADNDVTISKINTDISGKTHRNALLRELQIEEGRSYRSIEYLTKVVDLRVEQLQQRRLFKEFSLKIDSTDPGNIEITIVLVDSFTILPRPMVKYSSSQGVTLGLKVDYFNAFGTLSDHMVQGCWSPGEILFEYRIHVFPGVESRC
jgi:outer membrane protein assembly factor BamA